jgi:hypothetical protein
VYSRRAVGQGCGLGAYASAVPVSRKRKKKKPDKAGRSSGRSHLGRGPLVAVPARDGERPGALGRLAAFRDQIDTRRTDKAASMAAGLVTDLVKTVADQPDTVVADELCARVGTLLAEADQAELDVRVGPNHLAEALVVVTEAVMTSALTQTANRMGSWHEPWRVLTGLAGVLPYPFTEAVDQAIARLRKTAGGRVLPAMSPRPTVTAPVLMTRDRYGSRFAVVAPISTDEEPARWYLWDVDACGHEAFTVHSGFYLTSEAALVDWRTAVGDVASAGAVLSPVDDPWLLAGVLPSELGFMRPGGESVEQFAEYHRSKRLAEIVKEAVPRPAPQPTTSMTATTAATEFAAWLRTERRELPAEVDELVEELTDSWNINSIAATFATCSPHRVALCVLHLRGYYQEDIADALVALLPDWIRWLATRTATAPELVDRCLPYAHGQPHPQIGADEHKVDYLIRVSE